MRAKKQPQLELCSPVSCFALYRVVGGKWDGHMVAKHWEGGDDAKHTNVLGLHSPKAASSPKVLEFLPMLTYRHTADQIHKILRGKK